MRRRADPSFRAYRHDNHRHPRDHPESRTSAASSSTTKKRQCEYLKEMEVKPYVSMCSGYQFEDFGTPFVSGINIKESCGFTMGLEGMNRLDSVSAMTQSDVASRETSCQKQAWAMSCGETGFEIKPGDEIPEEEDPYRLTTTRDPIKCFCRAMEACQGGAMA